MMRHKWHGRFRGCGYRITVPRQAIMDEIHKSGGHLSAEDIFLKVHRMYPNIGLTTVYRTLEILTQIGLVSKFDFGDGKARYELSDGPKKTHHHHLICTECKRVVDYTEFIDKEIEFLKIAEKGLSKKYNFDIKGHLIRFYGVCDKCSKKK